MNKILTALLILLASSATMMAQRQLVVTDVETLQPVTGANVQDGQSTQTTDSLGHFMAPDGDVTLVVSHVNYETRIVNTSQLSTDTLFVISKLLNVREVVVFGRGKVDDEGIRELNRRLRLTRTEAPLLNAKPNGNLFGLLGYLIPKKWRSSYRREQRRRHHEEVLRAY